MHKHDPVRQISFIQQALSQNSKPIGFFLGAGCPLSIRVNEREEDGKTVTDPLIWDVAGLTKVIAKTLSSGDPANPKSWDKIVQIVKEDGGNTGNIELILSRIRVFASVAGIGNVRGLTAAELKALDSDVCKVISKEVTRTLPDKDSPYHNLAIWSRSIRRERPFHLFTTNYDLYSERAMDLLGIHYVNGFMGYTGWFHIRRNTHRKIWQKKSTVLDWRFICHFCLRFRTCARPLHIFLFSICRWRGYRSLFGSCTHLYF